tara:strand:- start:394 stop:573 length:180 start_codon:yes stop_codon:yes gene_type:complete
MTKSLDEITRILQEKGENLNEEDVKEIRGLYVDLSIRENQIINDVEEIIFQIQAPIKDT